MQAANVKRLKEVEHKNSRLKRIVAGEAVDVRALKDVAAREQLARHGATEGCR